MKTTNQPARSSFRQHGMTLLEVVMALAVFSIAALALVGTINKIADVATDSQKFLEVEQTLESLIDEYGKSPQIREMEEEIKAGADGVSYRVVIEQVKDLKNQEGRFLQDTFHIRAFARWNDGGGPTEITAETLRYAGAFLPVN
jgi:prepilin-type N-terminal cleavage/methylation domain-containing protein